jgi:hypothetical protein
MYSITKNIYYSQLSSVAILLQPEPVSHRIVQGNDCVLSPSVLSSCGLPLPPTCLLVTVIEARSYFASTILQWTLSHRWFCSKGCDNSLICSIFFSALSGWERFWRGLWSSELWRRLIFIKKTMCTHTNPCAYAKYGARGWHLTMTLTTAFLQPVLQFGNRKFTMRSGLVSGHWDFLITLCLVRKVLPDEAVLQHLMLSAVTYTDFVD